VTNATFSLGETSGRGGADHRLLVAITISLVIHALAFGALRGRPPVVRTFAEGGAGSFPALQAVLAGPVSEPVTVPEELPRPEPLINPELLQPPVAKPVETLFGRRRVPTAPLPGGGPARNGPSTPDLAVAVGTIPDPAQLGPDYVSQLAQRFPNPVQTVPMLLGAPVVAYPRAAAESGIQGRFAVVVGLDAQGRITDAKPVVDDALFGPVMLDALKNAQFAPAQYDGNPVPYWAIVEFVFTIGKTAAPPSVAQTVSPARVPVPRPSRLRR
jgi:outer membrane biosynthesis protein TonB